MHPPLNTPQTVSSDILRNPIFLLTEAASHLEAATIGVEWPAAERSSQMRSVNVPPRTTKMERQVTELVEAVSGVELVSKDRWKLKCDICKKNPPPVITSTSKKFVYPPNGAPVQCVKGKCTRTYHPTCALLAGLAMKEIAEWSTFEDRTNGRIWKEKVLTGKVWCPAHDPRREEDRKAAKEKWLQDQVERFRPGRRVWVVDADGLLRTAYPGVVLSHLPNPVNGCQVVCFDNLDELDVEDQVIQLAQSPNARSDNGDTEGVLSALIEGIRNVAWKHLRERAEGEAERVLADQEVEHGDQRNKFDRAVALVFKGTFAPTTTGLQRSPIRRTGLKSLPRLSDVEVWVEL
ncbi:hypothetical protein HDU93_008635 [Gonapodya sp. JEL0774]|nr:hypothetical protein HDU93_008635 [Gonapodya sp. JEL0774]